MGTLDGRVALVTGGGDGIGLGIARRLAAAGAAIVIAELDPTTGQHAVDAIRDELDADATFIATDVTVRE